MSHCQICEREIKDKTGVIAHHGYQRQHGWQTKSCMGARNLPYEKSRDVIPKAIESIKAFIEFQKNIIIKAEKDEITFTFLNKPVKKTDRNYPVTKSNYIYRLNKEITQANFDLERLQKRYVDWKEANL